MIYCKGDVSTLEHTMVGRMFSKNMGPWASCPHTPTPLPHANAETLFNLLHFTNEYERSFSFRSSR